MLFKMKNNNSIKYFILLSMIILFFASCEKNIDIDFPPGEKPYVIEGYIENGEIPLLSISRGISFLNTISNQDFLNLYVNNATVNLSIDGGAPVALVPISFGGATFYTNFSVQGEVGKRYDLTIEVDGKTFNATTTVLAPHPLDSIVIEPAPGDKGTIDSLVQLTAYFTEPQPLGNYYRILTKKNQDLFYDVSFNSIFDDGITNGDPLQFTVFGGKSQLQNNDTADFSRFGYFKKGDTVYVKWASIDKAQYDFWNTFESQSSSFGNPFSPTVIIKSSITGKGSLGIWASYGSHIDTVIIPRD